MIRQVHYAAADADDGDEDGRADDNDKEIGSTDETLPPPVTQVDKFLDKCSMMIAKYTARRQVSTSSPLTVGRSKVKIGTKKINLSFPTTGGGGAGPGHEVQLEVGRPARLGGGGRGAAEGRA
jgi:hypothetical protein